MSEEKFEAQYNRLKQRLESGEISKEEFWDSLATLELSFKDPGSADIEILKKHEFFTTLGRMAYHTLPIVIFLGILYFAFFYYSQPRELTIEVKGIGIIPATSKEKAAIYRGLELILQKSPQDYEFVSAYVDTVEVSGPLFSIIPGSRVGGYYRGGSEGFGKTIRVVRGFSCPAHCEDGGWNGRDLVVAEFIIHEACHSMQYHKKISYSEDQCYNMQFDFAERVGPSLWQDFNREFFIYENPENRFIP